jgi:hypothetical protein
MFYVTQGRSVHVNRDSRVRPANTLKNKKSFLLLLWFSIHWNTAEPIRYNASIASFSQPGVVSQLVEAYARRERSAVFQYMQYHRTTKVRQKTFYFSFSKVLAGQI